MTGTDFQDLYSNVIDPDPNFDPEKFEFIKLGGKFGFVIAGVIDGELEDNYGAVTNVYGQNVYNLMRLISKNLVSGKIVFYESNNLGGVYYQITPSSVEILEDQHVN